MDKEEQDKERQALAEELCKDESIIKDIMEGVLKLPAKARADFFKKAVRSPVLISNSTYYKQKYALQLIPDLQEMIKEKVHLVYLYSDFPRWSKKTLYLYVNESFRYALEFLDDDNKWIAKLREQTEVCQDEDAVRIIFKDKLDTPIFRARKVKPEHDHRPGKDSPIDSSIAWKTELMMWMEKAEKGQVFTRTNLDLSDENVTDLNAMFESDENFGIIVPKDRRSITVRRLT